jgi:acetyl-CoA C-acetyltransferase
VPTSGSRRASEPPFAKVDGALAKHDAIELSVPVVRHMIAHLDGRERDLVLWGEVVPCLGWSDIAREVLMDARSLPSTSGPRAC